MASEIKKYDVICPYCCGCFHETNEEFSTEVPAKGNMFTPKQHIVDAGWSVFPPYDTTEYMNITCPSCGQPYVDSEGRVLRLKEIESVVDDGTDDIPDAPAKRRGRPPKGDN